MRFDAAWPEEAQEGPGSHIDRVTVRGMPVDQRPEAQIPSPALEQVFGAGVGPTVNRAGRYLRRMEASKRRADALVQSFAAWLADRPKRPTTPTTRYLYTSAAQRCMDIAAKGGYSLLAGDVRVVRYVLGQISPHPSTQNHYLSALRSLFEFLREQGLRTDNPAAEVGRPPDLRRTPRPLDVETCRRYEAAAIQLGPIHETIAVLGLYQGWRRDEMRLAQWRWFFEADDRVWADVIGKGGKRERVPVHPRTLAALRRLRDSHRDPTWLFPSPRAVGEPRSRAWMRVRHLETCRQAGIEDRIVLHQLRHSYATYLRKAGADLALVQLALRHSSPQSTQIYMRVFPEELASVQEQLIYGLREVDET